MFAVLLSRQEESVCNVTLKAKNILNRGLAGAFVWSVEMGDYRGSCGHGSYPLLSAIHNIIGTDQHTSNKLQPQHPRPRLEKISFLQEDKETSPTAPPTRRWPSQQRGTHVLRQRKSKLRRRLVKPWQRLRKPSSSSPGAAAVEVTAEGSDLVSVTTSTSSPVTSGVDLPASTPVYRSHTSQRPWDLPASTPVYRLHTSQRPWDLPASTPVYRLHTSQRPWYRHTSRHRHENREKSGRQLSLRKKWRMKARKS
ncbi:brain chitinase and chia-like protein, partial [Elysia marginata]